MSRSHKAAAGAVFGLVVACLGGCAAGNPVAPMAAVETGSIGTTYEVAKRDLPFDAGVRGTEGGSPGSDAGANVDRKVRKPKKPRPNPHGE